MADNKDAAERRAERQDLGWLAQSAVLPRKRRAIEGVGGAGLLDLQAELYRQQVEAAGARRGEGAGQPLDAHARRSSGVDVAGIFARSNRGVEARDLRDKEQHKATRRRPSDCYASLERKAQLYDRLAAGEVDDADDKYEVDFLAKGKWRQRRQAAAEDEEQEEEALQDEARGRGWQKAGGREEAGQSAALASTSGRYAWNYGEGGGGGAGAGSTKRPTHSASAEFGGAGTDSRERVRREWEAGQEQEAARLEQRQQHKEALRDVAAAAREGREEAQAAKEQREREAALKRERLKAAFLKKQAAAIMASAAPAANQAAAGSKQPPQLQPQ